MRYSEIKLVESKVYLKEGARIDHAEDIIFWEGSKGAIRALESLKQMEQGGQSEKMYRIVVSMSCISRCCRIVFH